MQLRNEWSLKSARGILSLSVIIALVLICVVVNDLYREQVHEIASSSEKTAALAKILEAGTHQSLQRMDASLQSVNSEIQRGTGPVALRAFMSTLLKLNAGTDSISVVDSDGRLIVSTRQEPAGSLAAAVQQDYFAAHQSNPLQGLFVGANLRDPVAAEWRVPVSVRIGKPGEPFQGVIMAAVAPAFFQTVFDAVDTGSNGFATLFTREAWIAVRSPSVDALFSQNWRNSPMFREHLPAEAVKTVRQVVAADGIERIYSYRALSHYPVIVSAGVSLTDALAPWRTRMWNECMALIAVLITLAAATIHLMRQLQKNARTEAELNLTAISVSKASLPIFWIAPNAQIMRVNQAACDLHGYSKAQLLRMTITELDPDFPEARWPQHWAELRAQKRMHFETRHRNSAGLITPVEVELNFVEFEGQEYNFAYVRDIAARKKADAAQIESELFARTIADTVPGMLSYWDTELKCSFANTAYMAWFKRSAAEIQGMPVQLLMGEALFEKNEPYMRAALAGEPQQYERTLQKEDGELSHLWVQYIPRWSGGAVVGFLSLVTDIANIKKAQQHLEVLLHEKDALLKEVHHRVKNNLQVITSLLRMEARRNAVPEAFSVLKSMQGRIFAMAQLHEMLYRSGTFASVDLGQYLGQIAGQTFHMHRTSEQSVQLRLDMGSVLVGMDQAIVVGLIVNELVTNCLKHGFTDGQSGEVFMEFKPVELANPASGAFWRLRVGDTGRGWPTDLAIKRHDSLGLQLVDDLCLQAGGTLEIKSNGSSGTRVTMEFRVVEPAALVMPV